LCSSAGKTASYELIQRGAGGDHAISVRRGNAQFVVRPKEHIFEPRFEVGRWLTALLAHQLIGPVAVEQFQMPCHREANDAGAEVVVRQPLETA
jgi:hypothetical protein